MSVRKQTPSQTVGPFFAYALTPESYGYPGIAGPRIASPDAATAPIVVEGRVLDGAGAPVTDALVEIWQADPAGRYGRVRGEGFFGFGRCGTDREGRFRFETVKPGRVAGPGGRLMAPHLLVCLTARGLLNHLFTRIYFGDEEEANRADPILQLVPEGRRDTLIAAPESAGAVPVYRLDIHLQGERETVFFDL